MFIMKLSGEALATILVLAVGAAALAACVPWRAHAAGPAIGAPTASMASAAPRTELCARGNDDIVSERLCAHGGPIRGLSDLQRLLGLTVANQKLGNGQAGNASFVLLGHSTSISGRLVSPINPRAILFSSPASVGKVRGRARPNADFVAMAFTRGEQLVELVARDRTTDELRFFLLRFSQACSITTRGCSNFDLFSPAIEREWTSTAVLDESDLRNTPVDCLTCHQPDGPGTRKLLRMHELEQPWTHFFRDLDSGSELIRDYYSAHDEAESYAGLPGRRIRHSQPSRLEGFVENEGFRDQPNTFPAAQLGYDRSRGIAPEKSRTYADLFDRAQRGSALAIPAPFARPFDGERLRATARGYRAAVTPGSRAAMPYLGDLLREDARWMVSLRPKPGSDGRDALRQMCARCHNPSLDQTLSRARFDATQLESMSRSETDEAIARLRLPDDSPLKMPPPRFGELDPAEVALLEQALTE